MSWYRLNCTVNEWLCSFFVHLFLYWFYDEEIARYSITYHLLCSNKVNLLRLYFKVINCWIWDWMGKRSMNAPLPYWKYAEVLIFLLRWGQPSIVVRLQKINFHCFVEWFNWILLCFPLWSFNSKRLIFIVL